jgi:hypothetical protein
LQIVTVQGVNAVNFIITNLQKQPQRIISLDIESDLYSEDAGVLIAELLNSNRISRVKIAFKAQADFPGFERLFADYFSISQSDYVQRSEYKIVFPEELSFRYRVDQDNSRFEGKLFKNVFSWEATQTQDLDLMITTADSWDDVTSQYQKVYLSRYGNGLSSSHVSDLLVNLKESSQENKIKNVLNFLRQNFYYHTRIDNEYGLIPDSPDKIFLRGWGDCKDMALLGFAILRKLNVDSFIVLTGTTHNKWAFQLPDPFIFTHALLGVKKGKQTVYYDWLLLQPEASIGGVDYREIRIHIL